MPGEAETREAAWRWGMIPIIKGAGARRPSPLATAGSGDGALSEGGI